jgi:hypothetical protein
MAFDRTIRGTAAHFDGGARGVREQRWQTAHGRMRYFSGIPLGKMLREVSMAETGQHQRLATIESMQSRATSLLAFAMRAGMKDEIQLVINDLEEGLRLLRHADERPTVGTTVDLIVKHARSRLKMIVEALQVDGPDAELKGEADS